MAILGRHVERIYALLRIIAGLVFMQHGAQKLFGLIGGQRVSEPLMILAGTIEFFAGLLIVIGLFASIAAFIAAGEMAVAYFMMHAPQGPWPVLNKGELAILYCFTFLYIAARGSGIWSVDELRGSRK